MTTQYYCYHCQKELSDFNDQLLIGRRETCSYCQADLRCCKMCLFYDPKSYNECRETSADRVKDKEKANFCDYFKLSSQTHSPNKEREDALARAAALFKKS